MYTPQDVIFVEKHNENHCFFEIANPPFCPYLGTPLGPYEASWTTMWPLGSILEPSWDPLEPSWGLLGASCEDLGATLGLPWSCLSPSGVLWVHLGAILEPPVRHFTPFRFNFGAL